MTIRAPYLLLLAALQFTSGGLGALLEKRGGHGAQEPRDAIVNGILANRGAQNQLARTPARNLFAGAFAGLMERDTCSNGVMTCSDGSTCDQCHGCCAGGCQTLPFAVCCSDNTSCEQGNTCWTQTGEPGWGCCPPSMQGCYSNSAWVCCYPGTTCSSGQCVGNV